MKTTKLPKLLIIRSFREACREFYSKFTKFDVTYLTVGENPVNRKNFRVVNTSYYPQIGTVNNLSWTFMKNMEKYIRETDIVCISDNYYLYNLQAVTLAKKYHKKIVTILWATIPNHISSWLPPYSFVTKRVVESSDLFILRNKSAESFSISIGVPKHKIEIIYKGINLEHFYPSNKNTSDKQVNILYVGKLIKSKGVLDLLESYKKLVADGLDVKLTIVGSGDLEKLIKRKTKGMNNVELLGFSSYKNLPGILRNADIFCSPSTEIKLFGIKIWEEYFSYTLMEAQASGLPIVTTKSKGVCEEVDSRNMFVEKRDIDLLYKSLKKLVLNKNLRIHLGKINRERAKRLFNAEVQAQESENVILKIC